MIASPLANRSATRAELERFGLFAKHRLGQNFLVDDGVVARILELARLDSSSRVLEVGPGIGTLTLAMLPRSGSVVSIEADRALEPVLVSLAHEHANFAYIIADALRVDWSEVCARLGSEPNILVSNLPYGVAATLILKLLSERPSLGTAVVMVQAEVADRICAQPGTKAYGGYTAKLALFGRVSGRFEVPPSCFAPAPHVNSAVVRIDRAPWLGEHGPLSTARLAHTARVIDAAFAQRRKTIRNSMSASGFEKSALDVAFAQANIAPTARAEMLSPADFVRLATALEL